MRAGFYVEKTDKGGYEYGLIKERWEQSGRLPHSGWVEAVCTASWRERLGVAPDFYTARAAAEAAAAAA